MNTRKTILFCNLAIIVLCIASILSYFMMPFWTVKAEYTLTAETLQGLLPETEGGETQSDGPIDADDIYANLNLAEIVGEDGITLKVAISLETADILSALSTEPTELVKKLLDDNVHNLVDQMSETLNGIVKKTVSAVVKTALSEGIKEEIKNALGEGATDEDAKAELNAAGLTDEYLDEKTTQLVDSIYADGATSESAANATMDIVEESIQIMKNSGNPDYADIELTPEAKAELKETLIEQFKNFENEDGTIDPEAFTSDFLLSMIKGESDESNNETAAVLATPLSAKAVSEDTAEQDATAELRQVLTDKLLEALGSAEETIALVIKILSYVIIATFVIWALPILKIALKWNKHNNSIKVGLPIWLGSLPYIILCFIPTVALNLLKNPPESLAGAFGGMEALNNLSISFNSCAIVSCIAGIMLAVFVIFFYGKQRKMLKEGGGYTQTSQPKNIPEAQKEE